MSTVTVVITYPSPGNVSGSGTFTSYGTHSVTPTMGCNPSAVVTDTNGATVKTGSVATPPGGATWAFKFTGLAVGVAYNLNVQAVATDGGNGQDAAGINCTSP